MRRWALGALSVWPLLFLPVAAAVGGAGSPAWFKALTGVTILLSMALVFGFAWHAYRNPAVSEDGKVFWIVVLCIGSLVVTPVYWLRHLRRS